MRMSNPNLSEHMTNPVIFYNFSSSEASKVTDLRSKSDNLIETRIERNVVKNNMA